MTIIYALCLLGLLFHVAIIITLILTTVHAITIAIGDTSIVIRINLVVSLLVISNLLIIVAYRSELLERKLYILERRRLSAAEAEASANFRQITWLTQLARFLRHEVRQPIAQINSSLEIAQIDSEPSSQINMLINQAKKYNSSVWNLVERACLANDSQAFVRQSSPQKIDLCTIVNDQVRDFAKTILGVKVEGVKHRMEMQVFCDPALLEEALINLLSNAASYAEPETTILVEIEVEEGEAIISVRNKGPLLSGPAESLFGPFLSTRGGPDSEHQGLGLYIVRLIAEHYKGKATIRNLLDGTGVLAAIHIPVLK